MHPVEVEALLLSERDGAVHTRVVRQSLVDGGDPDVVARSTVADPALVHSTSWRRQADGTLVLTYVVLPDPDPAGAEPLDTALVVSSGDPLRPSPYDLHGHHVIAHAVRHVAALVRTDPVVAAALAAHAPLRDSIVDSASRIRTGAHEDESVRTA